jgi:sugar lactone lactonase YvrE
MKQSRLTPPAFTLLFVMALAIAFPGCKPIRPWRSEPDASPPPVVKAKTTADPELVEVARSEILWTGIALSSGGRIFVCFPRWSDDVRVSVGEVKESGGVVPYPDTEWNDWDPSKPAGEHFVCVQSVWIDDEDNLWILDPASPYLQGVVAGGAKLVEVELSSGKTARTIHFDEVIAPAGSYLNDVRVDSDRDIAYITDSGLGALIVVDLGTGKARRLLAGHPSTKSEDTVLTIGGREWRPNGQVPRVHADGLALDRRGDYLYYHALTARTLYRIETRWLRDPTVTDRTLGTKVESLYETCAADGMGIGPHGYLYLTSIEDNSIKMFVSLGKLRTAVKDPRLKWPDSIAWGPEGYAYVTTSQIHLGSDRQDPYGIFKFKPQR